MRPVNAKHFCDGYRNMPLIENLEFGGGGQSDMLKYIPTVEEETPSGPPPGSSPLDFSDEKNSGPIEMDFSTPIQDVMPSAAFDPSPQEDTLLAGPYKSPTTSRVVGLSPGITQGGGGGGGDKKGPAGLTKEQMHALIAGVAAVVAFSKPVQTKLADFVPKFLGESGDLSVTGMAVTALIAAVLFYFANRLMENQS